MYTNKSINIISFVITLLVVISVNFFVSSSAEPTIEKISNVISSIENSQNDKKEVENVPVQELGDWYIEIPSINLKAPIAEGTSNEILNTKVGHFEETSLEGGNIGLAAHNEGYEYNYFKNLKKVKKEDQIKYTHGEYKKVYIIDVVEIIENTDWSYLGDSDENRITLITCVENEPQYRRCVQAVEM